MRTHVLAAYAHQIAFETGQSDAIRLIPERLNATVSSMPSQHRRSVRAIAAVAKRSERIRHQVRCAITALQAGDITRQRLEHAEYALSLVTDQPPDPSGDTALTPEERQEFATTTCRLQSAQLSATAEEFERNRRRIAGSLTAMAGEARILRSLAASTYGSAEHDQGTFIGDLEAQVGAAISLFEDYRTARAEAAQAMVSVSVAAESLCEHLRTVQSLEDDIRVMGLNTTLQCARVGPEGRPLGLIAQELRAYGNEFAREASALIDEVERLTTITGSFSAREPAAAALVTSVMDTMRHSLACLQESREMLDDTLASLDRDSLRVVTLLEQTAAEMSANDAIGEALRRAAERLEAIAPSDGLPLPYLAPFAERMVEMIARGYTMASERFIHDRILGVSGNARHAEAVAQPTLEDMLF